MKTITCGFSLVIAWLLLCAPSAVQAQSASAAVLRCDPAVIIYKIDGKSDAHGGTRGAGFEDCAIPLSAGKHTLEVCYDFSSTSMNAFITATCGKSLDLPIEVVAGRTYRLKIAVGATWKAWVDDVTEAEAAFSYAEAAKKPKPAERKTTLVLQVSPATAIPHFFSGKFLGPWFVPSLFETKAENTGIAKAAPDGFVIVNANTGNNLTIANVRILEGSVFTPKIYYACGDYQTRVFEDVAGGKVLYLGHMHFKDEFSAQTVTWSDDIDAARQYVDAHFPKLAGKLEPTPFTSRKFPRLCAEFPLVLTNAP